MRKRIIKKLILGTLLCVSILGMTVNAKEVPANVIQVSADYMTYPNINNCYDLFDLNGEQYIEKCNKELAKQLLNGTVKRIPVGTQVKLDDVMGTCVGYYVTVNTSDSKYGTITTDELAADVQRYGVQEVASQLKISNYHPFAKYCTRYDYTLRIPMLSDEGFRARQVAEKQLDNKDATTVSTIDYSGSICSAAGNSEQVFEQMYPDGFNLEW